MRADNMSTMHATGSFGNGTGQLNLPQGIALFNGTVFVADSHNSRIAMFVAFTMEPLGSFGSRGSEPGQLSYPDGLCIWRGELYVADSGKPSGIRPCTHSPLQRTARPPPI